MVTPTPRPVWLSDVTLADLDLAGIAAEARPGEPPGMVLARWADEYDVDFAQVDACLALLCSRPVLLHVDDPLALMAYSPRRERFRVSIDTDTQLDQTGLSRAGAGAWLTVLASAGAHLPIDPDHDSLVRLEPAGMCAPNPARVHGYRHWARIFAGLEPAEGDDALTGYEARAARAVWRCAGYALR